jgi:hypothetical protein
MWVVKEEAARYQTALLIATRSQDCFLTTQAEPHHAERSSGTMDFSRSPRICWAVSRSKLARKPSQNPYSDSEEPRRSQYDIGRDRRPAGVYLADA